MIALSEEMQRDLVDVPDLPRSTVLPPAPDPRAIAELPALLAKARKPLAILGGSTWTEEGRAAIKRFLLDRNIPVSVAFRRQGTYDGTLANFVGDLGVGSDPALVARAREADLILAIGTRLPESVTQGYTLFDKAGATPIVHGPIPTRPRSAACTVSPSASPATSTPSQRPPPSSPSARRPGPTGPAGCAPFARRAANLPRTTGSTSPG